MDWMEGLHRGILMHQTCHGNEWWNKGQISMYWDGELTRDLIQYDEQRRQHKFIKCHCFAGWVLLKTLQSVTGHIMTLNMNDMNTGWWYSGRAQYVDSIHLCQLDRRCLPFQCMWWGHVPKISKPFSGKCALPQSTTVARVITGAASWYDAMGFWRQMF